MEIKDKQILSSLSMEMWAKFSDASEYRKKIDRIYDELLKIKEQLNGLDCKTADDFECVSRLTNSIGNFYMLSSFPTWEDYEREASALDSLHEELEKQIEKEENK
jgi:hypothetical protein